MVAHRLNSITSTLARDMVDVIGGSVTAVPVRS
jgi:hypothetical protein